MFEYFNLCFKLCGAAAEALNWNQAKHSKVERSKLLSAIFSFMNLRICEFSFMNFINCCFNKGCLRWSNQVYLYACKSPQEYFIHPDATKHCMVQSSTFVHLLKFSGILCTSICIIHMIPIGIVWCNLQDKQDLLIPDSGC